MKCTRTISIWGEAGPCGRETGKPCPPQWVKHQHFDPLTIRAFFHGVIPEGDLATLDAFVCSECMPKWKEYLKRSAKAVAAVAKRQPKPVEDYSI